MATKPRRAEARTRALGSRKVLVLANSHPMGAGTDSTATTIVAGALGEVPKDAGVLSGTENMTDGKVHAGVAIDVKSGGGKSTLMIPDVTKVSTGDSPVYLTKPIVLELAKLSAFLTAKKVTLPSQVENLMKDSTLSCGAFYYVAKKTAAPTEESVLLLQFAIKFDKGAISSLTNDEAMGELFDIKGAAVRVYKCPAGPRREALEAYVRELVRDSDGPST
jgi:hypothetical protein